MLDIYIYATYDSRVPYDMRLCPYIHVDTRVAYEEEDTCVPYEDACVYAHTYMWIHVYLMTCVCYHKDTCVPYEEEDTCVPYEEEDTCVPYEDTCVPYEEEDTCVPYEDACVPYEEEIHWYLMRLHVYLMICVYAHVRSLQTPHSKSSFLPCLSHVRARALSVSLSLLSSLSLSLCLSRSHINTHTRTTRQLDEASQCGLWRKRGA